MLKMSTQRDVEGMYINAAYNDARMNNGDAQSLFNVCKKIAGCCCLCSLFWFIIGLIGGVICLYVFSIIGLVNNWDTVGECNSSHLRELVITYLVLAWLQIGSGSPSKSNKRDTGAIMISLVLVTLLCGGIAIWSGIEVLDLACSDIKDTMLYGVGFSIFIANTILGGIGFLGVVIGVIVSVLSCFSN